MKKIIALIMSVTLFLSCFCVTAFAENADLENGKDDNIIILNDKQNNSIAILNYLTFLTKEINESKNSRLFLENVYSSLISNTNPDAVDYETEDHISELLDQLETYRMLNVKRERLEYIYEQNQAKAIRAAIPNPLGLLSAVQSMSLKKLVASVVYMAVDSVTSYENAKTESDLKYLQDGWALDDEEAQNLHETRKQAFMYMLDIVRNNNLPGELALSEKAIDELVLWENNSNVAQRIRFLEKNQKTYEAFGGYWIILAKSYFENEDYKNCLNAVSAYENIQSNIFRKDYELAQVIPLAISSAEEEYGKARFLSAANHYLEILLDNTDNDDWALRYFAAQTYVDLYSKSKNTEYLKAAFEIALDNVNTLIKEQKTENEVYLADIKKVEITSSMTKEEKQEAKQYNKMLEETRKKELAPIYEPLQLNCDLLFELIKKIDLTQVEKTKVDSILHEKNNNLFLIDTIDDCYRFDIVKDYANANILFNKSEITVPAQYVSPKATISAVIINNDNKIAIDDWTIKKVERNKSNNIEDFQVIFTSKEIKKADFNEGTKITVKINPNETTNIPVVDCNFVAEKKPVLFVFSEVNYIKTK